MATIKAFTDLPQSKVLAEFLPIGSADCYWEDDISIEFGHGWHSQHIPCWSLAALLNILPEIQGDRPIIALDDNYITYPHMSDLHTKADNLVDACVAMIEKLHELKMF